MVYMNHTQPFYYLFRCILFVFFWNCPFVVSALVVERLVPVVVAKLPHDLQAFTQGLAIEDDQLYESTGLYGQSSLRRLDISTGKILQQRTLASDVFAEGLAAFPQNLLQIT